MKNQLLVLLFLLLAGEGLTAQSPLARQWEIALGGTRLSRQDLVFSPFVHQGHSALQMGLTYRRTRRWEQSLSLDFVSATARHQPEFDYSLPPQPNDWQRSAPHQLTLLDVAYRFARPLARRGAHTWWIGGAVSADLDALAYNHARNSNFGYFLAFGAAVLGQWAVEVSPRHHLNAQVQLPLLAWAAHSPYLINDDDFIENVASHRTLPTLAALIADGQLSTWNRYRRAGLDLRYTWTLSRHWQLGAGFRADCLYYREPRPLRAVQQQLTLRGAFVF